MFDPKAIEARAMARGKEIDPVLDARLAVAESTGGNMLRFEGMPYTRPDLEHVWMNSNIACLNSLGILEERRCALSAAKE